VTPLPANRPGPRSRGALRLLLVAGVLFACGGQSPTVGGAAGGARDDVYARINELRATLALPPLARWSEQESCADGQARADAASGTPHSAFGACGESAQNECPAWPSLDRIASDCLQQMWNEGPGSDFQAHGHYINMTNTRYTKVVVGFHVTERGTVWALMDFR
jgi:hypothetical protein